MSWIKVIPFEAATGKLKRLYERVKGPDNNIDNILSIHSLRPHSLQGHMVLYKNVLHNSNNTLPKWYLEALGVYTSHLNACDYCFQHHYAGFARLIGDDEKALRFKKAVMVDQLEKYFSGAYLEGCRYAKKLTFEHQKMEKRDVERLSAHGFTDGEILEINQVVSYFNYVNRTVLGLGVNTKGDILGLSPNDSDDPDNWGHQ